MSDTKNRLINLALYVGLGFFLFQVANIFNSRLEKSVLREFNKSQISICKAVKESIIVEFKRISFSLEEMARDKENQSLQEWNEELMEHIKVHSPLVDGFYYLNSQGIVLARMPKKAGVVGADFSGKPGIIKILKENRNVLVVAEKVRSFETNIPSITFSFPYMREGKLKLIARAIVHMDGLSKKFMGSFEGYNFAIVNASGTIIADTDPHHISRNKVVHEIWSEKTISMPLEYGDVKYSLEMVPDTRILEFNLLRNQLFLYSLFGLIWLLFVAAFILNASRKRLKNELRHRRFIESELSDKSVYLDNILRSSTDMAIAATDLDFKITYYNPMAEKLFGYTAEEAIGRTVMEMHVREKVDHSRLEKAIEAVKKEGVHLFREMQEKNGTVKYIDSRVTGIYDRNKTLTGFVLMSRDVTEKQLVENDLRQAKEEAETASRMKSDFLANVSHELRTPLTSIKGFPVIIQKFMSDFPNINQSDIERVLDCNTRILSQSDKLLELVDNLIDLAAIESNQMKIIEHPVSAHQMLAFIVNAFEKSAEEKGIGLSTNSHEEKDILFLADKLRLEQILCNLMQNAIKFMDQGTITLSAFQRDPWVVFQVKDEGVGLTKEEAEAIFESFHQLDTSSTRKHGGLGLGLDLSRKLVEKINGEISVESEKGKGSTFVVKLPWKRVHFESPAKNGEGKGEEALLKKKILLVEDDTDVQYLVQNTFPQNEFVVGGNGKEGLEILQNENDFDVIFLDRRMPEMNGDEFMREMKARFPQVDIPIVMLTAMALQEEKESAEKLAQELGLRMRYISKPFDSQTVIKALNELGVFS